MLVYNSQTHKKEELVPIEPGKIRMYVCGPTVYDQIRIGNARTFLAFDVIRRYLMYKGYQVTFAQNLTDVDDKIDQPRQRDRPHGCRGRRGVLGRLHRADAPLWRA